MSKAYLYRCVRALHGSEPVWMDDGGPDTEWRLKEILPMPDGGIPTTTDERQCQTMGFGTFVDYYDRGRICRWTVYLYSAQELFNDPHV